MTRAAGSHRSLAVLCFGVLVVATLMIGHGSAEAISAGIGPSQQTIQSGETATWGAAWGEEAPYSVTFSYGDGGSWSVASTTAESRGFSRGFVTCTTRSYTQKLDVEELDTSATITATASTSVIGGSWCR